MDFERDIIEQIDKVFADAWEGGHPEYITFMAEAISAYNKLAHHYSIASENKPNYFIKRMKINPLVITNNRRFMGPNSMGVLFASCSGNEDINTLFTKQEKLTIKHSSKGNRPNCPPP